MVAFGCGSDGNESTATRAAPRSAATAPADDSALAGAKGLAGAQGSDERAGGGSGEVAKAKGTTEKSPPGKQNGEGSGGSRGGAAPAPASEAGAHRGGSRTANSNSGRCPSGVSRAECEVIAEQVSDTPSYSVSSVEDCVKAIGKEGCERLLETERASQGGSPSIDVNECLKNPTPRCEAALRPILEAEQAASNATK